jgi:phage baseplate assembly protein gpV
VGALPVAGALAADAAKPAAPAKAPVAASKSTDSGAHKSGKAAMHAVSGTLESYDAAGKTLTVKSTSASWTFDTAAARVWEGSKSVGVEELSSHTGAKVTVKYTEHDGQKEASSIRLAPAHTKTATKSK